MGLKEKKITKAFQDEKFPALKEQITKAAGFDVPLEIEWETLFEDRFTHLYMDTYSQIYFEPLVEAFTAITADDMGKEALQEGLKKVVIVNRDNHHNPERAYTFTDGVLEVNHCPVSNAPDVSSRVKVLTNLLENNL
ncbi:MULTISPECIES: hypothetical protein [unclassified Cellulophaga]|uniref:hypothetical protein n=1 Tax=unclassified Cellulophaga TaxID=2634405 RepID=UPI000C2B9108|nr:MULTISPECIES: hypothetical protein [unclassified Cellulophaga]MDO6490994.1 hypothetical protein [Cellulophaga sp. 2_MG-2023]MDO6493812.1 hypothetical protein [Cellulophaga sp. 3_MG-2023]PKB44174.1 hypothetical protein AX016_2388 [Cellulophaga sp. RHA19]